MADLKAQLAAIQARIDAKMKSLAPRAQTSKHSDVPTSVMVKLLKHRRACHLVNHRGCTQGCALENCAGCQEDASAKAQYDSYKTDRMASFFLRQHGYSSYTSNMLKSTEKRIAAEARQQTDQEKLRRELKAQNSRLRIRTGEIK